MEPDSRPFQFKQLIHDETKKVVYSRKPVEFVSCGKPLKRIRTELDEPETKRNALFNGYLITAGAAV